MTRPTTDVLLAAAATWLAAIAVVAAAAAADPVTAKATAPAASPSAALPAPSGRSAIGTFSLHWIDPSRADPFVLNKRRELMVQLWYPSRPATAAHAARYLPPRTARAFERVLGISTPVLDHIGTHASTGARAASGHYPVVLFSPGFGTTRAIYTSLLEDLASHGFVVVAIDHPYDAGLVEFPDGRLEGQRFAETPAGTNRALTIRIADARFVLDRLPHLNARGPLAGKLDLQHIGIFGHSLGGATAAETMLRDTRVDAGANLDGSFRQSAERLGVRGPFMLITAPRGVGPSEQTYRTRLRRTQLRLTLRGAAHYTFTDLAITRTTLEQSTSSLPALRHLLPIGSIEGRRALAIQRRYLDAFFTRYLKGTREPLLTHASAAYPEVSFERGGHGRHRAARDRQRLELEVGKLVAAGAPGAAILVRNGDRTTLVARGLADTQRKRPLQPGDTFRIGSLAKTYVATLVLQLAEQGRLSLDDPVARFLPALIPGGDKITVRQLLNHTTGLYDVLEDPRVLKPYLAGNLGYHWPPRTLVRLAVSHRPLFAPGTRYSYSGTNYLVAGLIVERLTGSTLERMLEQRIFAPLHLRHSVLQRSPHKAIADMHGYYILDKPPATDITGLSPYPWAAGAIVANASDVASFYRALLTGRLFHRTSLRAMQTTVSEGNAPTDIKGSRSGLGLERYPTPCGTAWGHGGNFPGYNVYALTSTNGKRQLVLAINQDPQSLSRRANSLFMQLVIGAYCGSSHS